MNQCPFSINYSKRLYHSLNTDNTLTPVDIYCAKLDMRKWALDTLAKKTYLISDNYIYFMYEQDLLAFKLKFGKYL